MQYIYAFKASPRPPLFQWELEKIWLKNSKKVNLCRFLSSMENRNSPPGHWAYKAFNKRWSLFFGCFAFLNTRLCQSWPIFRGNHYIILSNFFLGGGGGVSTIIILITLGGGDTESEKRITWFMNAPLFMILKNFHRQTDGPTDIQHYRNSMLNLKKSCHSEGWIPLFFFLFFEGGYEDPFKYF